MTAQFPAASRSMTFGYVCRLYPLGRIVRSDGSEYFIRCEGHPQSAGEFTDRGTIADYLAAQDAQPFGPCQTSIELPDTSVSFPFPQVSNPRNRDCIVASDLGQCCPKQ